MSKIGKPIDFEVVRESWNKYELHDNSILKSKYVLQRLFKTQGTDNKSNFQIEGQILTVILTPDTLKGPVDDHVYSPEELSASIVNDDVRYTTLAEEWNEYIADDATKIKIKTIVSHVRKTSKFDKNGDPVYIVDNSALIQTRPPK